MPLSREQVEGIISDEIHAVRVDLAKVTEPMTARLQAAGEAAAFVLAAQIGTIEAYGEHLRRLAPPLTREIAVDVRESIYADLVASTPHVAEAVVDESSRAARVAELREAIVSAGEDRQLADELQAELRALTLDTGSPDPPPALRLVEEVVPKLEGRSVVHGPTGRQGTIEREPSKDSDTLFVRFGRAIEMIHARELTLLD